MTAAQAEEEASAANMTTPLASAAAVAVDSVLKDRIKPLLATYDPTTTAPTSDRSLLVSLADQVDQALPDSAATLVQSRLPYELLIAISALLRFPPSEEQDQDAQADVTLTKVNRHHEPLLRISSSIAACLIHTEDRIDSSLSETIAVRARLIMVFAKFSHQDPAAPRLCTAQAVEYATASLSHLLLNPPTLRLPILDHLLSKLLPPIFKPHPHINPTTGRAVARPAGGANALLDWFDSNRNHSTGDGAGASDWRIEVGLHNVVRFVVASLEKEDIESRWHLVLPPLLTYLGDYSPLNKLLGVDLLSALLERTSGPLLTKTGVGKVFSTIGSVLQSLDACLSSLSSPYSPFLLLKTHQVYLSLLHQIYPAPSPTQASSQAHLPLLQLGIIRVWEFHPSHIALFKATIEGLGPLLRSKGFGGMGTIRFLGVLVPHLVGVLETSCRTMIGAGIRTGRGLGEGNREVIEYALRGLKEVVRNAEERIRESAKWKGMVLVQLGKTWVVVREDEEGQGHKREELETLLRELMALIGDETDRQRFLVLDEDMFGPLFANDNL
ncbi:BZ3500_MvSof-1268-A1-R1_Chr3-1g05539 [Microbotryum saponariae]|uniref:BZ3500_MvSof-1268-A1-R1_Chr3-1g05539 protein n=1 Tax=Microbotryum saponariae TaxID=289078 RepID=A0A2X0LHS8_9BASI|nr:BZ3500_MvSof-1268-A1-R1_Chr3-1g05539 [Microbotryum saponariae]SDA04730.1 BZ3501_MvSof-1269-A2-R1_Chr3-1g05210 [Microbotryum saponariae]